MTQERLEQVLEAVRGARVAVVGDFCLDVYWFLDMEASEMSVETGLATRPVRAQRYAPGGAGNVVANLAALGVGRIESFGVVGADPWGRELVGILEGLGSGVGGMLVQDENWTTPAYVKPHLGDQEESRLDFGNYNRMDEEVGRRLLERMATSLGELDVVLINQQLLRGIHSESFRRGLAALAGRPVGPWFVVDSRDCADAYLDACSIKVNASEARRLAGIEGGEERVTRSEALAAARFLFSASGRPVYVTRGERGVVVLDGEGIAEIEGIVVEPPLDAVGAGDAMLAGIAAGLGARCSPREAAELGNLAASVTVSKLRQTGTATPAEVSALAGKAPVLHQPDLAEDPGAASFWEGTGIEIVTGRRPAQRIAHAVFDHDGTISTLRHGWEQVMEPVMMEAILGRGWQQAEDKLRERVRRRVVDYIDRSTGVQTLVQMNALVGMVREFGIVPESSVLDGPGYKKIYNDALMERVRARLDRAEAGGTGPADAYTLSGAVAVLEGLRAAGVRLYLASGTDQEDVQAEAELMGYAALFEGRIHGAVGDVSREAKRMVVDRILENVGEGGYGALAMFGDGPVEIREASRRGCFSVGVASDEVARKGLDARKRKRVIEAGADVVVTDFAEWERLLSYCRVW